MRAQGFASRLPLARCPSTPVIFLGVAALAWIAAVAGGFALVWRYKSTPGASAEQPPARWPAASRIERTAGRFTLVMFVHPHCPCSRASVAELGRLMGRLGGKVTARVSVLRPGDASEEWDHTSLGDRAAAVPGVVVQADEDGREAARFNAVTSGQTLVYDPEGRLIFSGGLTSARGHEGDSFGQRRILSLVTTGRSDRADSPTFGCSLIGSGPEVPSTLNTRKDGRHEHE